LLANNFFSMVDITVLVKKLSADELGDKSYEVSDDLARIGGAEVLSAMVELLKHANHESRFMAARTLGLMTQNEGALKPILEAINDKSNLRQAGDLLATLENYDLSGIYVELFKFYLFGTFKVSAIAKDFLDHKDFDISPRVIKKATKHWHHYANNVKQDELFDLKKIEIEEMLEDLKRYVGDNPEN